MTRKGSLSLELRGERIWRCGRRGKQRGQRATLLLSPGGGGAPVCVWVCAL